MNDLPSQLREAAEIIEKGLPWEWQWTDVLDAGKWSKGHTETSLLRFLHPDENKVVRKKPWTLPAPPPGRAWHRTDWQEDMLPEGWRPLLSGETYCKGDEYFDDGWSSKGWSTAGDFLAGSLPGFRARTRRPLPVDPPPPVMVPLEAADIIPGTAFRDRRKPTVRWWLAGLCGEFNVNAVGGVFQPAYQELFEHYDMLRPGRDPVSGWEPCQKEQKPA